MNRLLMIIISCLLIVVMSCPAFYAAESGAEGEPYGESEGESESDTGESDGETPFPVFEKEPVELPLFTLLPEIGDSAVWAYTPSTMTDPVPTLTSVLIVFPDEIHEERENAMQFLEEFGFIELAEKQKAGVILINYSGDGWTEQDVSSYEGVIRTIAGAGMFSTEQYTNLGYTTYLSQIYLIGEMSGATFINDNISQDCDVVAGAALFGGEIHTDKEYAPMPVYLFGAGEEVIEYYKSINGVKENYTDNGITTWYDPEYDTKRVIIDQDPNQVISMESLQKAWDMLFSRINRSPLCTTPVWSSGYEGSTSNGPLTLMDIPNTDELGLIMNDHCSDPSVEHITYWCEWIPEEALEEENEELFPLIMVYHGAGDDPVFEAEQNGWVEIAGEDRIIVVAPSDNYAEGIALFGDSGETQWSIDLLNYICEKYPVDESRIYLAGFSLGASQTVNTAREFMDRFAAIAPLAPPTVDVNPSILASMDYEAYGYDSLQIDLPMFFFVGTKDNSVTVNDEGVFKLPASAIDILNKQFLLNEVNVQIDLNSLDYDAYPFYGFEVNKNEELSGTNKHGANVNVYSYYNGDNEEMVRFVTIDDMDHNHYTELGRYAWEFMKQFTRVK